MRLKKCPCCGSAAQLSRESNTLFFRVKCKGDRCNIMTPLSFTEGIAVEKWNNRYFEQSQDERVKYALKRLEENGFEARCVNDAQGLIHCYDRDGELVCYYATPGKIQGSDKKGILRLLDRLRGYNG